MTTRRVFFIDEGRIQNAPPLPLLPRLPAPCYNSRMQLRNIDVRLLIGDWLVLLLFVFIGQRDHGMSLVGSLPSLLTTALTLALPWTAMAWVTGVLRLPDGGGWRPWLGRVAVVWLAAAPLGLALRALLRGQASIILPFMLVVLGLGGAFVLGWRAAYYWLRVRRTIPG